MISGSMPPYVFGSGAVKSLPSLLAGRRPGWVLWLYDHFFRGRLPSLFPGDEDDQVFFIDTTFEPTVESVDEIKARARGRMFDLPRAVVGIGGGSTMDTAKAVSILLTNPGKAEDYQGWGKVNNPAIYKIGVPTISGTGSESSSTAVLTNHARGLKLGINSPHSRFDQVVLDPDLTATVPREQRFYTGMDTFCHVQEYFKGNDRNAMIDALADLAWEQVSYYFDSAVWETPKGREMLMLGSYFGGAAAGCTGLIHPFSAGLSMVLGLRHGLANCVALQAQREFYPAAYDDQAYIRDDLDIELPIGLCGDLSDDKMEKLYNTTLVHEKPLRNALGPSWRDVLTRERVYEIFRRM